MSNRWQGKTHDELAEEADSGLRGQGAMVEANRCLARSTNWLTFFIAVLTAAILALTVVMVFGLAEPVDATDLIKSTKSP